MSCLSSVVLTKQTDFFARGCPRGETEKAALPVTEVVHCTVWVAGTGLAATGAICEVILLAVLTLQTSVALHTRTLTGALVTVVGMWNPLKVTAAVTKDLWVSGGWGVTKKQERQKNVNNAWRTTVVKAGQYWPHYTMMNIVYFTNIISQQNISNATSSDLCNVQNRDFKTFLLWPLKMKMHMFPSKS